MFPANSTFSKILTRSESSLLVSDVSQDVTALQGQTIVELTPNYASNNKDVNPWRKPISSVDIHSSYSVKISGEYSGQAFIDALMERFFYNVGGTTYEGITDGDLKSFELWLYNSDECEHFTGVVVSEFQISCEGRGVVKFSFGLVALRIESLTPSSAPVANVTDPLRPVLVSSDCHYSFSNSATFTSLLAALSSYEITTKSFEISLHKGITPAQFDRNKLPRGYKADRFTVTATASAYCKKSDLLAMIPSFRDNGRACFWLSRGTASLKYAFPAVYLSIDPVTLVEENNDVMWTLKHEALYDYLNSGTIRIISSIS